jgi:hypothetical protein
VVPVFAGNVSLTEEALEPNAAPFLVHAHDDAVKFEQFAESETPPPTLVEGLWPILMLQAGFPVLVVPVMQVTCVPETDTLLQPLMLNVTSARARDVYIAAAANIVIPIQNANRGRAKTDGFDGFISTP